MRIHGLTAIITAVLVGCSAPSEAQAPSPTSGPVPAEAPDTVPEGFYDSANYRTGSACSTGAMLRGIVVVVFEEGTTQEEKQEAVDLVGGEVVGGMSGLEYEGCYYVRVEDDPDGRVLCEAIDVLYGLPQVGVATPSLAGGSLRRRPDSRDDGTKCVRTMGRWAAGSSPEANQRPEL